MPEQRPLFIKAVIRPLLNFGEPLRPCTPTVRDDFWQAARLLSINILIKQSHRTLATVRQGHQLTQFGEAVLKKLQCVRSPIERALDFQA